VKRVKGVKRLKRREGACAASPAPLDIVHGMHMKRL
jgi:hypothetical protein